jgi:hypothetical protein
VAELNERIADLHFCTSDCEAECAIIAHRAALSVVDIGAGLNAPLHDMRLVLDELGLSG